MKQFALGLLMIFTTASAFAAPPPFISFKGHVRAISVSAGGFANMTTATIEVTLDVGVVKRDTYSICQDVSEREYNALLALLIDSRSRNQESSFHAKPFTAPPELYCINSITSP